MRATSLRAAAWSRPPSSRQRCVVAAGRKASLTSRPRAPRGSRTAPSATTSSRSMPISASSRRSCPCGWPAEASAVSPSAPIAIQASEWRLWSSPGTTTAPRGRRETVPISRPVDLVLPVDPATTTGPKWRPAARRAISASISLHLPGHPVDLSARREDRRILGHRDVEKVERDPPIAVELGRAEHLEGGPFDGLERDGRR